MKIHIVQKGDSLEKIAERYEVDFEELKKAEFMTEQSRLDHAGHENQSTVRGSAGQKRRTAQYAKGITEKTAGTSICKRKAEKQA